MDPAPSLTSPKPTPSLSPPRSLYANIESSPKPPRCHSRPRLSHFTCCHLPQPKPVTPSTTQVPSPGLLHHSWACNAIVLPEPVMLCTPHRSLAYDTIDLHYPQAHNAVVLPEPVTWSSPRCPRAHDAPELATPSSSLSLQCYIVYFSSSFWAYKSWFWYATLSHCFDMQHCFDILHFHIATLLLFCYILINMNVYYIAHWRKWAKWDECGNMDQHYYTIKISASTWGK
jgi:hypothetical protein